MASTIVDSIGEWIRNYQRMEAELRALTEMCEQEINRKVLDRSLKEATDPLETLEHMINESKERTMSFDTIPEDEHEGYPCDCGGSITRFENKWSCDNCDFEAEDEPKEKTNDRDG